MTLSKARAAIRLLALHRETWFGPDGRNLRLQHLWTAPNGPTQTGPACTSGRWRPKRLPNVIV